MQPEMSVWSARPALMTTSLYHAEKSSERFTVRPAVCLESLLGPGFAGDVGFAGVEALLGFLSVMHTLRGCGLKRALCPRGQALAKHKSFYDHRGRARIGARGRGRAHGGVVGLGPP